MQSAIGWTGSMRLHLELTDSGSDHTVLSEFRTRLVAFIAEERFLEAILTLCKERGWRHLHVDESLLLPLMCWPRFVRSTELNVW
jgi:hypothetical protein